MRETVFIVDEQGSEIERTLDFRYDNVGFPYALHYEDTFEGIEQTYYYITNLQGDVMYMVGGGGDEVASYDYDPYGKLIYSTGSMAEVNPIRYRGYYYDTETNFYYLQSRYYDPTICRFINADGYASTGQGLVGYNMFAYCNNNPSAYSDPAGTISLVPNKRLAIADTGAVSGGGGGGLITLGILKLIEIVTTKVATSTITIVPATVIDDVDVKIDTKTETKEKKKEQAYFPVDPFQFVPRGLVMRVYPGSKNGRIIKWMDPITKIPIFEWNEDFVNGAHYHALLPEWGGKHDGLHYLPGAPIPEPWNSIYFGG